MTMVSLLEFVDVNNGSIDKKETGMGDTGLMHMNIISSYSPIIINNKRQEITSHSTAATCSIYNNIIELGPTQQCIISHRRILKYE